jgi:hypothetical protein
MTRDDRQPDLIDHLIRTKEGIERAIQEEEERQAKLHAEEDITLLLANCLSALRLVPSNISISKQFQVKGVRAEIMAELEKRKSA